MSKQLIQQIKHTAIEQLIVDSSCGRLTVNLDDSNLPVVLRGVTKHKRIDVCVATNRDYYYTDTGYFGNFKTAGNNTGVKVWHRIVRNNMQLCHVRDMPGDRWQTVLKQDPRLAWTGWKNYKDKILLVLPSPKTCKAYGVDYDHWIDTTTNTIRTHSNLPIKVRHKLSRRERNNEGSIYDEFDQGVYATVCFNSIAALESVLYGIPAFVSVPCAAAPLAAMDLSQLSTPFEPSQDLIEKHCRNLAYGQFSLVEITNGTAWKILQRYKI